MLLKFLVPNQAWAFVYGKTIVQLDGEPRFFVLLSSALKAADRKGLIVRDGRVSAKAA